MLQGVWKETQVSQHGHKVDPSRIEGARRVDSTPPEGNRCLKRQHLPLLLNIII